MPGPLVPLRQFSEPQDFYSFLRERLQHYGPEFVEHVAGTSSPKNTHVAEQEGRLPYTIQGVNFPPYADQEALQSEVDRNMRLRGRYLFPGLEDAQPGDLYSSAAADTLAHEGFHRIQHSGVLADAPGEDRAALMEMVAQALGPEWAGTNVYHREPGHGTLGSEGGAYLYGGRSPRHGLPMDMPENDERFRQLIEDALVGARRERLRRKFSEMELFPEDMIIP